MAVPGVSWGRPFFMDGWWRYSDGGARKVDEAGGGRNFA